ncbi:MAG TPA: YidC/Oxa1 family membrane protein insertase [Gaiellaceae bacterium]|nr:YidC/Oxa1 family membrane protein insertase [Gaiellaceae bacterium]
MIVGIAILDQLETVLRTVLKWLGPHGTIGLPWAWAIVALTVVVRILIVPLAVKQIHSMQNLQRFAPQMKEIQQKYKADKQKQNEELMKFYKEHKINPAASCLPLIAQLPVFFSLYFVLRHQHSLIHYKCLKHVALAACPSASQVPTDNVSWLGLINITQHATIGWGPLLIVIYVASQLSSSYFMSTTVDKSQRILLMVLPIVFVPFVIRFPTGLVLYWVTTNLWTVGQGLITRRLIPKPVAPPKRSSRTAPKEAPANDGAGDGAKAAPAEPVNTQSQSQSTAPRRVKRKKKRSRR